MCINFLPALFQVIDMVKEETFVPRGRGGGRGGAGKNNNSYYCMCMYAADSNKYDASQLPLP